MWDEPVWRWRRLRSWEETASCRTAVLKQSLFVFGTEHLGILYECDVFEDEFEVTVFVRVNELRSCVVGGRTVASIYNTSSRWSIARVYEIKYGVRSRFSQNKIHWNALRIFTAFDLPVFHTYPTRWWLRRIIFKVMNNLVLQHPEVFILVPEFARAERRMSNFTSLGTIEKCPSNVLLLITQNDVSCFFSP